MLVEATPQGSDLASRANEAIDAELASGAVSLASVARRLAMSERSLQRRLEAEGIGFAALIDAARRRRAESLLRSRDVSLTEIAFLLGFSEQSAFTRAFKRWTGKSPRDARREILAGAPRASR